MRSDQVRELRRQLIDVKRVLILRAVGSFEGRIKFIYNSLEQAEKMLWMWKN